MTIDQDRVAPSGAAAFHRLSQTSAAKVLNAGPTPPQWSVPEAIDEPEQIPPGDIRTDLREPSEDYRPNPAGQKIFVEITLIDAVTKAPLKGHAVDLWHCNASGHADADDMPDGTWLRGIGVSDQSGTVRFTTVVPGCLAGQGPQMWLEVFHSVAGACEGDGALLSTAVALPWRTCAHIYGADLANTHGAENLNRLLLSSDRVLGDASGAPAMPEMSMIGAVAEGYFGQLTLEVGKRVRDGKPRVTKAH